jgi:hypothetical protein
MNSHLVRFAGELISRAGRPAPRKHEAIRSIGVTYSNECLTPKPPLSSPRHSHRVVAINFICQALNNRAARWIHHQ